MKTNSKSANRFQKKSKIKVYQGSKSKLGGSNATCDCCAFLGDVFFFFFGQFQINSFWRGFQFPFWPLTLHFTLFIIGSKL